MFEVRSRCRERSGIDQNSVVEPRLTPADIAESSAALDDPRRDQMIVEHDGAVVGYVKVNWWTDHDGTVVYLHRGWLSPECSGRGIGTEMVEWAEARITRLAADHGTADRAVFAANAADVEVEARALLRDRAYEQVFSVVEFELADLGVLPERPAALPGSAELRPVEPGHYRAVWEMVVAAYADTGNVGGWDFEGFVEHADPTCWQVCWDGAEVIGAALCVPGEPGGVGEVRELSVRKDWRRRGVGRTLLLHGLYALADHGESSVRLFTGSANPYRSDKLYESVGFRRLAEFGRYRKPVLP